MLSAFLRMLLNHGMTFFRQYSFASSILKLAAAAAAASSALATGSLMSTAAMLLLSFSFSFSFSFSISFSISFSFSFSMKGMTSFFVTDANFSISMLICMRMKRNASRMSESTSCSSFLIGKTKEKRVFLLFFPHLFVSLASPKILSFGNKSKNFGFCFVFPSLIRIFVGRKVV